jgi:hypothetical protein
LGFFVLNILPTPGKSGGCSPNVNKCFLLF